MRLCFAILLLAFSVGSAAAVAGDPALAIPQKVGDSVRYRISRTLQQAGGPQTTATNVTIQRKSATTAALLRDDAGRSFDVVVLAVAPDGSLQIPAVDRTDAADPAITGVLQALNRAVALVAGSGSSPSGWTATLPVNGAGTSTTPVSVPMTMTNATGDDADVHGIGQLAVPPAQPGGGRAASRRGGVTGGVGFPGGGGGFPGGGFPGSRGSRGGGPDDGGEAPRGDASGGRAMDVSLRVEGHIHHGAITRLSIVETRSVNVEAMPFVNVSSWTIEART